MRYRNSRNLMFMLLGVELRPWDPEVRQLAERAVTGFVQSFRCPEGWQLSLSRSSQIREYSQRSDNPFIGEAPTHSTREFKTMLSLILEISTVMPFRWFSNKYMCFYCSCGFIESRNLKDHMIQEHEEPKLMTVLKNISRINTVKLDISNVACKKCTRSINTFDDLITHCIEDHDMKISRNVIKSFHVFKLSDDDLSCLDCGDRFRFFGPLLNHYYKFHNKLRTFLCDICGMGFASTHSVETHYKFAHSTAAFPCKECSEVLQTAGALKKHKFQSHSQLGKCPKCPEVFGSVYLKKRHLALAHNVKSTKFQCDQCPKNFVEKNKLVNHQLKVHMKQKTVACEICGLSFFNNYELKNHFVKHTDARPFECDYCKKTFQRRKTLLLHLRIHTDDRRYVCKDCGKGFVQVTSLKSHVRSHHSPLP